MTDEEFKNFIIVEVTEIKMDLRDHMRRTEISEEKHERQESINAAMMQKLEPLERAHHVWAMLGKVAVWLSPIVGALLVAWLKAKFA